MALKTAMEVQRLAGVLSPSPWLRAGPPRLTIGNEVETMLLNHRWI